MSSRNRFSAFVAHGFDEDGRAIAKLVLRLLKKRVRCTTGDKPEPGPITEKIKRCVNEADALIAIIHKRAGLKTSRWVDQEIGYAMGRNKPVLWLVERTLQIRGLEGELEYIPFTREGTETNIPREQLKDYIKKAAQLIRAKIFGQFFADNFYPNPSSVDFSTVIGRTRNRIIAAGIAMLPIADTCERQIATRLQECKSLRVTFVLSDPRQPTSTQRAADEGDNADNLVRDVCKIAIRLLTENHQPKRRTRRLTVKFSDKYPTMAVAIFDDDLYAYFYGLGLRGTQSPMLHFRNYRRNPCASFFKTHLATVLKGAKTIDLNDLRRIHGARHTGRK